MTMALESGAESAGSAVAGEASPSSKKFGLSGSEKASALGRSLPQPSTHHPHALGLILIVGGCFMLVGSITGTLPSMIAALFDPNALVDASGATPGPLAALGEASKTITDLVDPLQGLSTIF